MKRGRSTLYRNYDNPTVLSWIDDDSFVGTITQRRMSGTVTKACYGWSKGAGFFIYEIIDGHIAKLGSVPRESLVGLDTSTQV